jgi:hypothetical protein
MTRRSFIRWLPLGWSAFTATIALMITLTTRFFFPNVLFELRSTFEAEFPAEIHDGEVDERFKSSERVVGPSKDNNLRASRYLYASRLHTKLVRRRTKIQMSMPRKRVLQVRH